MTSDQQVGAGQIAKRIALVRAQMAQAAMAAGRDPASVTLLPVSKTHPTFEIIEAARLGGLTVFGENRPQELAAKAGALADMGLGWSLIGPLQTNKAALAAQWASQFQALDSLKLAEVLDRRLQGLGRGLDVMIEVNTSGEPTKHGVTPGEALRLAAGLASFSALRPVGLMTVAANSQDQGVVRACFASLRRTRDHLRDDGVAGNWDELSMGMSSDFRLAIEEGSTVVRLGAAIFGPRLASPTVPA